MWRGAVLKLSPELGERTVDEVIILVQEEDRAAFGAAWAKAADLANVGPRTLPEPGRLERFDGGTLLEYGFKLLELMPAILLAVQPFLKDRRGKVIIGETTLEMENLTADEMERILRARVAKAASTE